MTIMKIEDLRLLVDGQLVPGQGELVDSINPYTNRAWARLPYATGSDVGAAVTAAERAFDGWAATPGYERSRLLLRLADLVEENADALAEAETTDNGKVIRETRAQMGFAARQYRYFAGWADKLTGDVIQTDRTGTLDVAVLRPLGPVALITAWNSPIGHLSNKLAPALAAGCTAVVKPSEHASVTTLLFARLVQEAGFPPGVVNVVIGDAPVGDALVSHPGIRKISFTGSPGVGRSIATTAAQNLTPVTLELGGKSPNIIFEDANLDRALVGALAGIFAASGQTCIAGSRLLVQSSVYDKTVSWLADRAGQIRLGDPRDPATEMGPVANRGQFERVQGIIRRALDEGADRVAGGSAVTDQGDALFVPPTVFAGVTNSMRIAREEVFGPVLSVVEFSDEADAVAIANDTEFGLAAGLWTENVNRALRVSPRLLAGSVWVNTYRQVGVQIPFGGFKSSGYGRERGHDGVLEYLGRQNVLFDYSEDVRDPFALKV